MNTKSQGDIGVALAVAYYSMLGYKVSVPMTDDARYDLIVDKNGTLVRVQCKTTRWQKPSGSYCVQLATSGGNQSWNKVVKLISRTEVDELFVYAFSGDCYVLGPDVFDGKRALTLTRKLDENVVWRVPLPVEN